MLHDLDQAVRYADDLIVLDSGRLIFSGTKEECLRLQVLEQNFGLRRYTFREDGRERIFFSAEPEKTHKL